MYILRICFNCSCTWNSFCAQFWNDPTRANVITLAVGAIIVAVIINIISLQLTARINNLGAGAELVGTVGLTLILGIGLAFLVISKDQEFYSRLVQALAE